MSLTFIYKHNLSWKNSCSDLYKLGVGEGEKSMKKWVVEGKKAFFGEIFVLPSQEFNWTWFKEERRENKNLAKIHEISSFFGDFVFDCPELSIVTHPFVFYRSVRGFYWKCRNQIEQENISSVRLFIPIALK